MCVCVRARTHAHMCACMLVSDPHGNLDVKGLCSRWLSQMPSKACLQQPASLKQARLLSILSHPNSAIS